MTSFPVRVEQSFVAEARSVAEARRFTRRTLEEWQVDELVDGASLIVSELVTNAVVHAGTPVRLVLGLRGHQLRIEVEDLHPGQELPLLAESPPEGAEHGRGLMITTSLSSAWGVEYTRAAKRVWAVCEREPGPAVPGGTVPVVVHGPRVAVVELDPGGRVAGWYGDAAGLLGWGAEEVAGRAWAELLDGSGPPPDLGAEGAAAGWQGTYSVLRGDRAPLPVFASHVAAADSGGVVVLLVAEEQRSLLEHPLAPAPAVAARPETFGLREDALVRLGVEEYLALAAERIRDPVAAEATWVLLAHDLDEDFEVVAVSGLDEELLGSRLAAGSPGVPDPHRPTLPVMVRDLAELDVPLLAGTGLRSIAVVPLVLEHQLVGALGAASAVVDGFDDDRAARLQRFADSVSLAADRARLQASERERRGWLGYLVDAGDLLAGSLDQDMTMAITGQIVVPRLAAWSAIHLGDSRGEPVLQQVWHQDEERAEELREAILAVPPGELEQGAPVVAGHPATSIPLVARGRRIGLLTLGRSRGELRRSELFMVAESVARRAALAIDNAQAHGALKTAGRALQESLLPPTVPRAPGYDVGVVYQAAGEDTAAGGDFYDLFPVGQGSWCFVVGDVCGTGAEAAAVTGLARHTIQALVRAGLPVDATLERLNTAILDEGSRGRFLTLVCGTLRQEDGRVRLELVNAGHPPPYVIDARGGVREVGTPQTLLGVVEHVAYVPDILHIDRGDLLVAVTDGVLERRSGDRLLGEGAFAGHLATLGALSAQAAAERIRRVVADFSDVPQHDDLAVLVIRGLAGGAGSTGDGRRGTGSPSVSS